MRRLKQLRESADEFQPHPLQQPSAAKRPPGRFRIAGVGLYAGDPVTSVIKKAEPSGRIGTLSLPMHKTPPRPSSCRLTTHQTWVAATWGALVSKHASIRRKGAHLRLSDTYAGHGNRAAVYLIVEEANGFAGRILRSHIKHR